MRLICLAQVSKTSRGRQPAAKQRAGKQQPRPQAYTFLERVPVRLTQNVVDGFGVTGVEGVFRIACELTMQLLRDNQECLMTVLEAFIHDPLVEWQDELRDRVNGRDTSAPC